MSPPPQPPLSPRPFRVLVAEDDWRYAELLISILQSHPRIVVVGRAVDGVEAVELAHALRPDVIVFDVNMPRLDGFEAAARIRKVLPHAEFLVISGTPRADHVSRARAAGALVYLPKDAGAQEIVSAVLGVPLRGTLALAR